jgi:5'-nucleotidase
VKVLLTNDDGYRSEGFTAARAALLAAGHEVLAVAPDGPRSGTSRSATFRRPVNVVLAEDDPKNPVYRCDGTPVDCVRVALLSHLGERVDVVVSGINEGANLGDDTTYSSTVGSAVEGALLGTPAIAASQQAADGRFRLVDRAGYDWTWSAWGVVQLLDLVEDGAPPPRSVINLNAPGQVEGAPHARATHLGERPWRRGGLVRGHTDEHGEGWYTFGVDRDEDPPRSSDPGTDFAAIADGDLSLTGLSVAYDGSNNAELTRWTESAAAELTRRATAVTATGPGS